MAKTKEYQWHPAAKAYPMFDDGSDEQTALVESIRQRGLLNDIVLLDGMVLDGRNRLTCCRLANVEPRFVEYDGDRSPAAIAAYVRDQNANRRHLRSDQKAAAIVLLDEYVQKHADAAKQRQRDHGGTAPGKSKTLPQNIGEVSKHAGETDEQLAKEGGTNRQYVTDCKKILADDRETVEQIRDGKLTLSQAKAAQREAEHTEQLREQNRRFRRPLPESIRAIANCPGILMGADWFDPSEDDWTDRQNWDLADRLDAKGGFIVFRTLGDIKTAQEAMSLIETWEMHLWPHQVDVGANDNAELLVIGVKGFPDVSRLPTKPRRIIMPEAGLESLVLSWFRPWAKERGTLNLIAEFMGDKEHEGFQFHPWRPEPVAA